MTDTSATPSPTDAHTVDTHTIELTVGDSDTVELTITDRGRGRPFLLLHGGAGPQSVDGFADLMLMAGTEPVRVITPIHPGFCRPAASPGP